MLKFRNPFSDKRGNAIVELAIALPVLTLTMFGVITGGLVFDRYMTVVQLARTGASVFSRGTDFTVTNNKTLLLLGSEALDITLNGGKGVIYLSRVQKAIPGSSNDGFLVIAERHVIGNKNFQASAIGTPSSQIWPDPNDAKQPNGFVDNRNNSISARATVPAAISNLPLGESMFIVEVYHESNDLRFGNVWGNSSRMSSRVFF